MSRKKLNNALASTVALAFASIILANTYAQPAPNELNKGARVLPGHIAEAWKKIPPVGRFATTNELQLAIGLPLQHTEELGILQSQLYDPTSTNFHRYLTTEEFTRRFAPTEEEYNSLAAFAETNGLRVTARHPNRLVLDVAGTVASVEKTFHVTLRTYRHPREARDFFAPDAEPSVNFTAPLLQVSGLNNYSSRRPKFHRQNAAAANALAPHAGTGPASTYIGKDFRAAYVPGMTNLTGAGQSVGLLQFDAYYTNDIARYCATGGITTSATLTNVAINGGVSTPGDGNGEVTLDIQMVLSMAPGVSKIYVYEAPQTASWVDILSRMANDNAAKQLSCSWGDVDAGAPDLAAEAIFVQMALQGQSFFNASGDSDAFTNGIPFPSESTNITQVGGTTLITGSGASWSSETVWNWGILDPANYDGIGSSGGISVNFGLPVWQQGMAASLTSAGGSLTRRNVPDVSLTADDVYNIADNGASKGGVGGTSCAAPLWAGFMALVNQQAAAYGDPPAGFINPAVYALGNSASYTNYFHDITTSSNTWSASPTKFRAVPGYDLCTGWGTPNGTNLINFFAPPPAGPAQITASPASQTNFYGATATLTVSATGLNPLAYQWYFTNAIAGATNSSLVLTSLTETNTGNYFVIVTNTLGKATSTVATLTVILSPHIVQQPQSQSILLGQTASLSVAALGAPVLAYQWRKDSNNIAGANDTNYLIASVSAGDGGYYDVVITNFSGSVTSSAALLTALNPAFYTGVIAGWNMAGLTSFGPSPMAATTNGPNVKMVSGFTRGSGFTVVPSSASDAWGGNGLNTTSPSAAISAGDYATFSLTASNGYTLSLSNISHFDYRRSNAGATNGLLQFSLNGSSYSDIATFHFSSSASSGTALPEVDLSGITGLQNVPAGTNITFRLVLSGATSSGGNWYIYNRSASGYLNEFEILGSLAPVVVNNAPTISVQPANTNIFAGKNAAFGVVASGTAPLTYQWRKEGLGISDGGSISGTRTNVLLFSPAATNQGGGYSVVVTNNAGSITSSVALLNVVPPPSLVVSNSSGYFVLLAENGAVSNTVVIQSATNLQPPILWLPVQTNVIGTNGQIVVVRTNSSPSQFYRLQIP